MGHCFVGRDLCPSGGWGGGSFEARTLGFSPLRDDSLCQQTASRKINAYYDEINFNGQGFQIFPRKSLQIRTSNDTVLGCVGLQISAGVLGRSISTPPFVLFAVLFARPDCKCVFIALKLAESSPLRFVGLFDTQFEDKVLIMDSAAPPTPVPLSLLKI